MREKKKKNDKKDNTTRDKRNRDRFFKMRTRREHRIIEKKEGKIEDDRLRRKNKRNEEERDF